MGAFIHSTIIFIYPITISHKAFFRLDPEDTVVKKAKSFPDLLKHDYLGGGAAEVL